MDRSDDLDIGAVVSRPKGRSRTSPSGRSAIVAAGARRTSGIKTAKLAVHISEQLIHEVRLLAVHERVAFNSMVAELLRAGINRRPTFVRYLKLTEEIARSVAADDAQPDDVAA